MASDTRAPARSAAGRRAAVERESLLAQAEELANVGSWELDADGNTIHWSAHFSRMLGLPPGTTPIPYERGVEVIHPDDRARAMRDAQEVRIDGKPLENDLRFVTADRGVRMFHSRAVPIRDGDGRIVRIRGMSQDVTEQREAEAKLREREAMLAHAEEIANLGSFQYHVATRKAILSTNLRKIFGLSDGEEWNRETCWEHVHSEDRDSARESMARGTESGKPFEFVMRFTPPGGTLRHLQVRGSPQADSSGRVTWLIGIVQDITDQRAAEDKLRERSATIEYAEKVAKLGSWRYDYATDSFTMSPNMRRILGIGPDDKWSSELYWSRVPLPDRAQAQAIFERATLERKPFEFIARFAPMNGGMARLCTRGITFCDASGRLTYRVGVVQDITEQYEVELKMREREDLLAEAERIAHLGSWKYEFETGKLTLSPQLRKVYGLGPGDEWTNEFYWSRLHPSDRYRVREELRRVTEEEKRPFEGVTRFVTLEGRVRHIQLRAVPVVDAAGRLLRRVGVARDITDEMQAEEELRRLSHQLMRMQDDERRHIARSLHETVGQSLAAMKMTLGRLRDTMPDADNLARALLKSATELADATVRDVRTVSYLMHPPMLDEAGLAPALRWYARGFAERSGIRVRAEIPEHLPRMSQEIEITIFRIVQEALTNLHRYSGSRTAHISVECCNGHIQAWVRDEGRGIAFPIRGFGAVESLGVGIAGMRERVTQLNGVFELETAAGKGTTVRITLPTKPYAAQHPAETAPESDAALRGKRRSKSHGA